MPLPHGTICRSLIYYFGISQSYSINFITLFVKEFQQRKIYSFIIFVSYLRPSDLMTMVPI